MPTGRGVFTPPSLRDTSPYRGGKVAKFTDYIRPNKFLNLKFYKLK